MAPSALPEYDADTDATQKVREYTRKTTWKALENYDDFESCVELDNVICEPLWKDASKLVKVLN